MTEHVVGGHAGLSAVEDFAPHDSHSRHGDVRRFVYVDRAAIEAMKLSKRVH